ncbi:hypothetical protein GCM10007853_04350 [Algimonas ampicilliniresistens]|uniref:Tetratricopeptide repeat protein n=1 Tax=Algimonas ampicilliniresistens TaxID=1298735 RepID=A0ABQ5V4U3_9PROT|nr:hypothetical protein [Algimonas ampicilliniresistens]GLQ22561.1 hypothetical protein GCM10007853_04350 [Algimonas ampicilliniresistens]
MKFYAALLSAILIASPSLQACEPLSAHEKEMRRLDKELAKAQKKLARAKARNPELFIKDGRSERSDIQMFVREHEFESATSTYERLMEMDVDNGTFVDEIEQSALDIVGRFSDKAILKKIQAYQFLAVVKPDNATYLERVEALRESVLKRAQTAKTGLRAEYDKVEGITWYYPKIKTTDPTAYFYIGTKEGRGPWLRLRVDWDSQYGWLFVNQVSAWHDGEKETLVAGDFERRSTSHVWEWKDVTPSERQIAIMRNLAASDEAILRFTGAQRHEDHTLSRADKKAVTTVLDAYGVLTVASELDE